MERSQQLRDVEDSRSGVVESELRRLEVSGLGIVLALREPGELTWKLQAHHE